MKNIKNWFDNKWVVFGTVIVLVAIIVGLAAYVVVNKNNQLSTTTEATAPEAATEQAATPTAGNCISDGCLAVNNLEYPVGQLPADVSAAVKSALDYEYKAYSTYNAVIAKLGAVRPFSMIVRAEESHIASLKAILDKYGEQIPANPYEGAIVVEDTRQGDCQIGVATEIANIALYRDRLLPVVSAYPDITSVFTTLMEASSDKHLPAFQRCS